MLTMILIKSRISMDTGIISSIGKADTPGLTIELQSGRYFYSREGNEPSGHAGMSIWRLPAGSNTPQLAAGYLTEAAQDSKQKDKTVVQRRIEMKLHEGEVGKTYTVYRVMVNDAITRRLEALGVNEMTPVTLMNKKGSGTVIIKVRGTRLALGRRISEGIEIREAADHE